MTKKIKITQLFILLCSFSLFLMKCLYLWLFVMIAQKINKSLLFITPDGVIYVSFYLNVTQFVG